MDNFTAVYKILSALEKAMDLPKIDLDCISAEVLGVSKQRWAHYLEMMEDVGYIKGIRVFENMIGELEVENQGIRITLKGLEYLQENGIMRRIFNAAKGIKDVIPGL